MTVRIEELSLENFKGLKERRDISFGSIATFLFGPNGYGKTTIFDGLELALTGGISRLDNENNEHRGKKHETSVVHHNKDAAVIVRLKIEVDGKKYTITRRLPVLTERLPFDKCWDKLETFVAEGGDDALGSQSSLTQSELEERIFGDQQSLLRYFKLLTYIPQTESIYFLKMDQSKRADVLSPLLDMTEHNAAYDKLRNYKLKLWDLDRYLQARIKEYDEIPENKRSETLEYKRLTNAEQLPVYDEVNPYDGLPIEAAKERKLNINQEIEELRGFLETFDPKEYAKYKVNAKLQEMFGNNTFIDSLVFRELNDTHKQELENKLRLKGVAATQGFVQRYLLQNFLAKGSFQKLEAMRRNYIKYYSALFDEAGEKKEAKPILATLADPNNGFGDDTRQTARQYLTQYELLQKNVNSSQTLLKELLSYRSHIETHATKLQKHIKQSECPLCGYGWKSSQSLVTSIKDKTDAIQGLISDEAKSLIMLESEIKKNFLDEISRRGGEYLERHAAEYEQFNKIRGYGVLSDQDVTYFNVLDKVIPTAKELIFDTATTITGLTEKSQKLSQSINDTLAKLSNETLARITRADSYNFDVQIKFVRGTGIELPKTEVTGQTLEHLTVTELNEQGEKYRKLVGNFIKNNEVKGEKIEKSYLYKQLFSENENNFATAQKGIKAKIDYLEQQFSITSLKSLKKYKEQQAIIGKLSAKMHSLSQRYDAELKKYQANLTQPLKVPFYIYSAKILQNSPYGQGIFIRADTSSSSIVFTTNNTTTHDALHLLSSGQLAVVSMAFHLAMNAVYTSKSLRLLIIDDPAQDMDSLNVHSFAELIRREFLSDFQVILSTHEDLDMQYLKYMFERVADSQFVQAINVQELFYGVK